MASALVNKNVVALRGRTSLRLEPELWQALQVICERKGVTVSQFVRNLEKQDLAEKGGRTSAVRVAIVQYLEASVAVLSREHA